MNSSDNAWPVVKSNCDWCGQVITPPKRGEKRFCNHVCRSRFHNDWRKKLLDEALAARKEKESTL